MDQISGLLFYAVLFAGEQGFVYVQCAGLENAVAADLVTLAEFRQVVPDDVLRGHLLDLPVPQDLHRPPGHQGQLVHCPLGANFLENADDRIDHHHTQEAHVHDRGFSHDQQHGQYNEHQIEKCQAVPENDFLFAAAGIRRKPRTQTGFQMLLDLLGGQPGFRGDKFFLFIHGAASLRFEFRQACCPPPEDQKAALGHTDPGGRIRKMIADPQGKAAGQRSVL